MTPLSPTRFWITLGILTTGALYVLMPVLSPFFLSALLAYLGDPLIDRLEARQLSRSWAVSLVFGAIITGLLLLLLILIPIAAHQFSALVQRLPVYVAWLEEHLLPWLRDVVGIDPALFELDAVRNRLIQSAAQMSGFMGSLLTSLRTSSTAIFEWLAHLILIPVATFYLLRDWDLLVAKVHALLPLSIAHRVGVLATEADTVIGDFLRGQLIVMAILGVMYAVGLAMIGIEFALLIGLIAGFVSFVPYLGVIVGIFIASTAAILQFHSALSIVPVLVVFGIGQITNDFFLTPKLVGDRVGLHPVAVLFSILAGGQLFGFLGILLSLPVAAVIVVLLKHAQRWYLKSEFYWDITD